MGEEEKKGREVAGPHARSALEEQREEERGRDNFYPKQERTEADTVRNCIKKEVRIEEWMVGGSNGGRNDKAEQMEPSINTKVVRTL